MAVEAQHLNVLFPPQILGNREMIATMMNGVGSNACNDFIGAPLFHGALPVAASNDVALLENAPLRSDSGLTYAAGAVPAASSKRAREFVFDDRPMTSVLPIVDVTQNHLLNGGGGGSLTFLGEDFSPYLLQQQSDIDRFTAQYADKVRSEMQRRRNQYSRGIAATVEEITTKKLRAKEEEIQKIGKLNSMLEERVKSLSIENQIWRELAQSNEATANALRSNLEQILAKAQEQQQQPPPEAFADDAQSCCGSNYAGEEEEGDEHHPKKNHNNNNRICRICGIEESCVLILPCRHLCLCTACSSSAHACPVCSSTKIRSLHVNLSS